jgi:hypothetical protein
MFITRVVAMTTMREDSKIYYVFLFFFFIKIVEIKIHLNISYKLLVIRRKKFIAF